jgi:hypothetical protein
MGSCFSRQGSENNTPRAAATTTETSQINNASVATPGSARQGSSAVTGSRPFKPRRDGMWTSHVELTRSMLHRQRTEFWETAPQYDGLVETWNSLRVAVELSHQNDLSTAQAVLDSAGITIPTGDLGQGCYDELGHRFVIPDFVLSEPSNIVDDVEAKPRDSSSTAIMKHEMEGVESVDEAETSYTVKVRMSSTAKDIGVNFSGAENVVDVKKRLMQQAGLTGDVKLFLFGKPLTDDTPLLKQGWDNHMIQAFVRE